MSQANPGHYHNDIWLHLVINIASNVHAAHVAAFLPDPWRRPPRQKERAAALPGQGALSDGVRTSLRPASDECQPLGTAQHKVGAGFPASAAYAMLSADGRLSAGS